MPPQVEEKSMVPTVLVGIGGTGAEVLARVKTSSGRNLSRFKYSNFDMNEVH